MPSYASLLRAQEIHDVARDVTEHLATISLGGGNIGEGGELYRMYCAACHRTAVRGGALAFVGTNAPALTDKSPALVAGAVRWGPGPMPAFPQSVLNDQQLDSIVQYVGYVQHPPNPGGQPMRWYGPVAEGLAAWIFVFTLGGVAMWIEKGGKG
jgi:ubiquinol-cytochrome c reductase cytochrome c subunit